MLNVYKFLGVACLATYLSLLHINGQQVCAPLGVVNLTISHDAVVSWDPNPDESCDVSYYLVYVDSDVGNEYVYTISRTSLSVSFLPVCDNYVFSIVAVSTNNVEGQEVSLARKIPLPADANLTVNMLMVTQAGGHWVHLDWSMDDKWIKCADRFRIIVHDTEVDHLQDIYTFNTSISIPNLSPCTTYEFGVMAIYNWEIEGPVAVVKHETLQGVPQAPRLQDLSVQRTSANLTWSVESYAFNKCPILIAEVYLPSINLFFPVYILDQPARPPFNVLLTDLQPQSVYLMNVTLVNKAGHSRPVLLVIQTP